MAEDPEAAVRDAEFARLRADMDAATEEADELRKNNAAIEQRAEEEKARAEELLEELEYVKKTHGEIEEERRVEMNSLRAMNSSLQVQLTAAQQRSVDGEGQSEATLLSARVAELEVELERTRAASGQELPDYEDRERVIAELKAEVADLDTEAELVRQAAKSLDEKRKGEIADLKRQIVELSSQLDAASKTIEITERASRSESLEHISRAEALKKELEEAREENRKMEELKRELEEVRESNRYLEDINRDLEAARELHRKLEALNSVVSDSTEDLARMEEMKHELEEAREENRQLEQKRQTELAEHKSKLSKMRNERRIMDEEMAEMDERRQMLEAQLEDYMIDLNCGGGGGGGERTVKREEMEYREESSNDAGQQKIYELTSEVERLRHANGKMDEDRLSDFVALSTRLEEMQHESDMLRELNRRVQEKCEKETQKAKQVVMKGKRAEEDRKAALAAQSETKAKKHQDTAVKWVEMERSIAAAKERIKMLEDSLNASFARYEDCNTQRAKAMSELTLYQMKFAVLEREQADSAARCEQHRMELEQERSMVDNVSKELDLARKAMLCHKDRSEEEGGSVGKKRRFTEGTVPKAPKTKSTQSQTDHGMMVVSNMQAEALRKDNAELRKRVQQLESPPSLALVAATDTAAEQDRSDLLSENARLRVMIDWYTGTWTARDAETARQTGRPLSFPTPPPPSSSSASSSSIPHRATRVLQLQRTTVSREGGPQLALGPRSSSQPAPVPRLAAPPPRPALEQAPSAARLSVMQLLDAAARSSTPLPPPPPSKRLSWKREEDRYL